MGMSLGMSSSSYDTGAGSGIVPGSLRADSPPPAGNPNPRNFTVIRESQFGNWCVVEVVYHGVTNYEGRKILILPTHSVASALLRNNDSLDPHFSSNPNYVSPIARFEPTPRGWDLAVGVALRGEYP